MDQFEFEIEKERIEIEKSRIKASKVKFWIGTVALGLITLGINLTIQLQKVAQEKIIQENLHLSKFVDHIINKDANVRRDIAQYFSVLSLMKSSKDRWSEYLEISENRVREAKIQEEKLIETSRQRDSISNLLFVYAEEISRNKQTIKKIQTRTDKLSSQQLEEYNMLLSEISKKDSLITNVQKNLISKNKTIIEQQSQLDDLRTTVTNFNETPNWLDIALNEVGVQEVEGKKHNERIVSYSKASGFDWVDDDETLWNSIFVNWVFKEVNIKGSGKANARSWLDWGKELTTPKRGCVVVFWRDSPESWKGHVGFVLEETKDQVKVIGGNQNNGVNPTWYSKERVLGYRWPTNN